MLKKIILTKLYLREDFKYPLFLTAMAAFLFLPSLVSQSHRDLIGDILFVLEAMKMENEIMARTGFKTSKYPKNARSVTMLVKGTATAIPTKFPGIKRKS